MGRVLEGVGLASHGFADFVFSLYGVVKGVYVVVVEAYDGEEVIVVFRTPRTGA